MLLANYFFYTETIINVICIIFYKKSSRELFNFKKWFNFLDSNIQVIGLSSGSDPSTGEIVTAIGWGKASDSADGISAVLREVDVPVLSNFDCNEVYGNVNDGHICIDSAGGKGTCSVSRLMMRC